MSREASISWRILLPLGLLLYAAAFGLRLWGIVEAGPQPDELHWQGRSYQILKNVRLGRFTHLTTHLPHPGIPAAYVMAAGQYGAERLNHSRGLSPGQPGYLDHLAASRIAAAAVSSLAAPLLLLGGAAVFGLWPSLLGAGLFALDPHHIGLSRQAHMDAIQTLLVLLTSLVFLKSLLENSRAWKTSAMLCWGLALSVKPTAVLLLPGLGIGRIAGWLLQPVRGKGRLRLLGWSDVWAGMLALALFGGLYTRLWHPVATQGYKLNAWLGQEIWIDRWGEALHSNPLPAYGALAVLIGAFLVLWRSAIRAGGVLRTSAAHLCSFVLIFYLLFLLAPHFIKNFAGYWLWTFGLSDTAHYAYGRYWAPPPYGYAGMLAAKLPAVPLIGLLLSVAALAAIVGRFREPVAARRLTAALLLFAAFGCWLSGLSLADKQAYRYLMPVIPGLYLLAGFGWTCAAEFVGSRFSRPAAAACLLSLTLLALQAVLMLPWLQQPLLFFNSPSGGLPAAVARGEYLSLSGQNRVVEFLQSEAEQRGRPIRVGVHGDAQALSYTYSRRFPEFREKNARLIHFDTWTPARPGEYVIADRSFVERSPKIARSLASRRPLFTWGVSKVPLISVYQSRRPTAEEPLEYPAEILPHRTGRIRRLAEGQPEALLAVPGHDRRDFLYNNAFVRITPGRYRVTVAIRRPPDIEVDPALGPQRYAARFELGSACQNILTLGELRDGDYRFECDIGKNAYLQLRAYWFGSVPLAVERVEVRRVEEERLE